MKYEFEVTIVMRGMTLVATVDSCYGHSPGFLFPWVLLFFFPCLSFCQVTLVSGQLAICVVQEKKKQFKKDNKADCMRLVTLRKWVN